MKNRPDFTWIAHPCEDQFTYTAPVGTFKPNEFGLHDMLGNVREWVADCKSNYAEAPKDGSAFESKDCEKRIARGGGWIDGPTWVRSGYRHPLSPNYVNYAVGFRVARDLD
jgi:formylglycine-generating enzyme required for sulfatase activity